MSGKPDRIELHIGSIKQLFNSFDPSPFLEKDLDQEAERYVVAWAAELDPKKPIVLLIYFADSIADSPETQLIPQAFKNYFSYRADQAKLEIHELLRIGWRSLAVGSLVLLVSLVASNYISRTIGDSPLGSLLAESFIILGWVANWRPLEIFLYDWWPIARKRRLYLRLATASIAMHDRPASEGLSRGEILGDKPFALNIEAGPVCPAPHTPPGDAETPPKARHRRQKSQPARKPHTRKLK